MPVGTDLAEVSEDGAGAEPRRSRRSQAERASARRRADAESAEAVAEGSAAEMPAWSRPPPGGRATAASGTVGGARAAAASETCPTEDRGRGSSPARAAARRRARPRPLAHRGAGTGGTHHEEGRPRGDRRRWRRARRAATAEVPAAAPAPAPPRAGRGPRAVAGPDEEVAPVSHIRKPIGAAHGGLPPDLGPCVDDGRGERRPPREAPGTGEGILQGQGTASTSRTCPSYPRDGATP